MTTETEITTTVETIEDNSTNAEPETVETSEDNSTIVEPENVETAKDNSAVEPENGNEAAVTETEQTLYLGKFKGEKALEKAYIDLEKRLTELGGYEKKYNELVEKQEKEVERITQERLKEAQLRGFQSVEQQEIADKVQVAEFEYYWNNLTQIDTEHAQTVQQCLQAYYQSGHPSYLEEAKRYFPAEFIERVAVAKSQLQDKLTNEFQTRQNQELEAKQYELAQTLRANFPEFLADLEQNTGKAQALQQFSNAGFITSIEDMKAFIDVYDAIAKYSVEQHLKQVAAQKVIDETKQKAVINGGSSVDNLQGGLKESYSQADIDAMPQGEFETLLDKHGKEFMNRIR